MLKQLSLCCKENYDSEMLGALLSLGVGAFAFLAT
jgi:hypothetical protein